MPLTEAMQPAARDRAFLDALAADCESLKKRERTRLAIQQAGCRLLDGEAPSRLKVADICREAGIAHGTFYLYYPDRQALISDLLDRFIAFSQAAMREASKRQSADPERAATATYVKLFEANPGLMNCLVNHLEDFPQSRAAFQRLNREWAERVVAAAERRQGGTLPREELLRRAYALGGMVDQYLAALLLNRDPTLERISSDREAVIDTLTLIWRRGMAE